MPKKRTPAPELDFQDGESPTHVLTALEVAPKAIIVSRALAHSMGTVAPRRNMTIATRAVKGHKNLVKVWRLD